VVGPASRAVVLFVSPAARLLVIRIAAARGSLGLALQVVERPARRGFRGFVPRLVGQGGCLEDLLAGRAAHLLALVLLADAQRLFAGGAAYRHRHRWCPFWTGPLSAVFCTSAVRGKGTGNDS